MLKHTQQQTIIDELNKIHNLNLSLENPQSLIDFYNSKEFDKAYFDLRDKERQNLNTEQPFLLIDEESLKKSGIYGKASIYAIFVDLLENQIFKYNLNFAVEFKKAKAAKITQKIKEIAEKYDSYHSRYSEGKSLVANIKIRQYLNGEDVENLINSEEFSNYHLTKEEKEAIKEHFEDNKLNDIYYHILEMEQDYLLEKIKNHHEDFTYNYQDTFVFEGRNCGYLAYKKFFDSDYSGEVIDSEQYNFSFLTIEELAETQGFLPFFRLLREYGYYFNLERGLEDFEEALTILESKLQTLKDFDYLAEYCKEQIENWKECFLLPQLESEIEDFIDEELRETKEQHINTIKIKNDSIITDWKASCTLSEAKDALRKLKAGELKTGDKVGNYTFVKIIEKDNQQFAKVGCHLFDLKQIEQQLKTNFMTYYKNN